MKPEFAVDKKDQTRSEREVVLTDLKPEINNFVFSRVPGQMTIDEFEKLSSAIYSLICESWDKFI